MDSPHAISFVASSAVALGGAVFVALLPGRELRSLALLVAGIGGAGVEASLSAGFAAAVTLVSFAGCAAMLARPDYRPFNWVVGDVWRQLGAAGAALLFLVLAYAAYHGAFAHVQFNGGSLATAAVGRLLFARDALATEAIAALVLIALVVLTVMWRSRERER
jgi:tryptophan-rich sensory protein